MRSQHTQYVKEIGRSTFEQTRNHSYSIFATISLKPTIWPRNIQTRQLD